MSKIFIVSYLKENYIKVMYNDILSRAQNYPMYNILFKN